jgi:hypothetical protein
MAFATTSINGTLCATKASAIVCSESEKPNKQGQCEPIITNTEWVTKCPDGYSLECSDEKKPGSIQRDTGYFFFRCIPRKPGMSGYLVSDKRNANEAH